MPKRKIVSDKKPTLRKPSKIVTQFDKHLHYLLDDMLDAMRRADGIGLAAVQVGVLKRAVVVEIDEFFIEMINPIILEESGEQIKIEGCLSVVGNNCYVKRPMCIKIKYFDRYGMEHLSVFEGLVARCCCHEVDHLDGIIFYDKKYDGALPEDDEGREE